MTWFGRKYWEGNRMTEAPQLIEDDAERERRATEIVLKDFEENFLKYERNHSWGGGGYSYCREIFGEFVSIHPGHYRSMELSFHISLGPISISVKGQDAERLKAIIKNGERARLVGEESQVLAKFAMGVNVGGAA